MKLSSLNYDEIIHKSPFIKKWKKEMTKSMKQMNPDWDEEDIKRELDKIIVEDMMIPEVTLDNNYTGETKDTNLLSVFDWALTRKPLIAGNATFYKNQLEAINPIANMLDSFLKQRKAFKKQMFSVEDVTSDEYKDLDRSQLNMKILANSYYGASGMPKSAFYSKWSGPATTGTAQSVISTTKTLFEGFLVNNYKFIDVNECIHYMNAILDQDYSLEDYIIRVSKSDLIERMIWMFYDDEVAETGREVITRYVNNLSINDVTKIFYKNNLVAFTEAHEKVRDLHDKIFSSVKNYSYVESVEEIPKNLSKNFSGNDHQRIKDYNKFVNKEYFMDPNDPPENIKKYLVELKDIYMKYVYIPFMSVDRIHRLKYFPRRTVCIVDTDSNILALDEWVNFCEKDILKSNYGRDDEHNRFIIINTLAYVITAAVGHTLDTYGRRSYIPEEYRPRFNMKNEFYFSKLVIGKKKKRYMSAVRLREGNFIDPYKPDVKGFEFMKATTSEKAKAVFDKIIKQYILESEIPNTSAILHELKSFENEILSTIAAGEKTYLPLGNAKDLEAYKDPYSQQGVRGAIAWNYLYPGNTISFPSKVSILKLNIFTPEDMAPLANTHPREYKIIMDNIFHNSNPSIKNKGLQVLAIPGNANIPEWCQPYIDKMTVVNNIIGQFKGVLDVFGLDCPEVGKQIKTVNRKTKKFSNIVRF